MSNEFDQLLSRAGGRETNAFTSADATVYYVSLPADKAELWASLESDRFANTQPRQFPRELNVVIEERRQRTESDPAGKLYENFRMLAFPGHPYGIPTIGFRADLEAMSRRKVLRFYRTHYTPANTVIAVAGKFDPVAMEALVRRYFGGIPARPAPPPVISVQTPQEGEIRFEIEHPAQPMLVAGFHVPDELHPDDVPLAILNEILSGGRTSRLYRNLVQTGIALNAGSFVGFPGHRYPHLFTIRALPNRGRTLDDVEKALWDEIGKLREELVPDAELKRVKTNVRADMVRELDSNLNMAMGLAGTESVAGDWRELFREIDELSRVTAGDVRRVAREYLVPKNRIVGRMKAPPPPAPPAPAAPKPEAPK